MEEDANVLKKLIIEHPDALSDRKILNALFLDYFPTEKLKRNILLMAFDEGIVDEMRSLDCIDNLILHRYESMLEQDYGISRELSEDVICLWTEVFDVQIDNLNADNREIETAHFHFNVEDSTSEEFKYNKAGSYEYVEIEGGIRLARFLESDNGKEITVPNMIKGQKVLEIGDLAFWDCEKVEKIIISDGIKNIGKGSFANCEKLKDIIFPNSLRKIGADCSTVYSKNLLTTKNKEFGEAFWDNYQGAFAHCCLLEEVSIPNNVIYLGEFSFAYCENLNRIILPEKLDRIEAYTFCSCQSLASICLPKQLKSIGDCSFFGCCNLKEIEFPKGLQEIGDKAFIYDNGSYLDCSLGHVFIPDSVNKIGEITFGRSSLMRILCNPGSYAQQYAQLHNMQCGRVDTSTLGDESQLFTTEDGFICETSSLGIRIARYIGRNDKREIIVPSSIDGTKVVEIGDYAFAKCDFIEKVFISNGIRSLGLGSFAECTNLRSIEFPDSLREIQIPSSTRSSHELIAKYGFNFTAVGAFYSCGLKNITVPYNVTFIGYGCFLGCENLRGAVILSRIETLESGVFSFCSSLYSVYLPESLKKIDDDAFSNCEQLKEINLPEGLKVLGESVFMDCEQLEEIDLPDNLEEIGKYVFSCCYKLRKVVIPSSVKKINDEAFDQESLNLQKDLAIYCEQNSFAYQYAYSHGIRCVTI